MSIAGGDEARGDAGDLLGIPVAPGTDNVCPPGGELTQLGRELVVSTGSGCSSTTSGTGLPPAAMPSRRLAMPSDPSASSGASAR